MPHYSDQSIVLPQVSSNVNEVLINKVGPGTYRKIYTDKDGLTHAERVVLHDEKAMENARNIDAQIEKSKKDLANYAVHENKLNLLGEKLNTAIAKHEDAERKSLKAESNLNTAESNLNNARANLESANQNLESANQNLESAKAETNVLRELVDQYPPNEVPPELQQALNQAEVREQNAQNEVVDAQNEVVDAQNEVDNSQNEVDSANDEYDEAEHEREVSTTETATSQISNTRSASSQYNLGQRRAINGKQKETVKSNDLFDLRSIGGKDRSINFRGIGKAQNTVSTSEYTFSPSRSFFLSDYKFADSLTLNTDIVTNPKVQPLILNEFQPYDMLSPADVLDGVGNMLIKLANSFTGCLTTPILKAGSYFISKALIDQYATDTSKIYGNGTTRERHYFTSDPVQVVQNMFNGGRWLNTYELPYFGGDYLKAAYSNNWTTGDSTGFLGALAGGEKEAGTKMLGIDFPSNPKFKANMAQGRDPISLEFYLINADNNWLKRNFQFLNAIYAGSNWLHMKYCVIRPPNVYHVLCPGRFQIYWAAIDVTVTFEGKLRRNEVVSNELMQYSKAIKPGEMLWPDAWKIKINIRDLTPNNFNLYAEYYMNGFNTAEVASLEDTVDLNKILEDAKNYFVDLKKDLDPAIEAAKKFAEQAGSTLSGIANELMTKAEGANTEIGNGKVQSNVTTTGVVSDALGLGNAEEATSKLAEIQGKRDILVAKQVKEYGVTSQQMNQMVEEELKKASYQAQVNAEIQAYDDNKGWTLGLDRLNGARDNAIQNARDNARIRAQNAVKARLKAEHAARQAQSSGQTPK